MTTQHNVTPPLLREAFEERDRRRREREARIEQRTERAATQVARDVDGWLGTVDALRGSTRLVESLAGRSGPFVVFESGGLRFAVAVVLDEPFQPHHVALLVPADGHDVPVPLWNTPHSTAVTHDPAGFRLAVAEAWDSAQHVPDADGEG